MRLNIFSFLVLFTLSFSATHAKADSQAYARIDLTQLETSLKTTGLEGWIHGDVDSANIFVFTYRNPTDFFDYVTLPIITDDPAVRATLASLHRHDRVRIFGEFEDSPAPVKHINISKVEVITSYNSSVTESYYTYKASINEVLATDVIVARVHAIAMDGKMLVIEYKDLVIPVFVKSDDDLKVVSRLYRGDKIRLHYKVRSHPDAPTHLSPLPKEQLDGKPAIEVLVSLVQDHGKTVEKNGVLVFFPQSPEINRNIFALQEADPDQEPIQYTLVNFEDMDLFSAILAKLQTVWDANTATAENGRNRMINYHIHVKTKGTMNMVSQSQANPQILLQSLDDLVITVE